MLPTEVKNAAPIASNGKPQFILTFLAPMNQLSDDASFLTGTCVHTDGGMGLG